MSQPPIVPAPAPARRPSWLSRLLWLPLLAIFTTAHATLALTHVHVLPGLRVALLVAIAALTSHAILLRVFAHVAQRGQAPPSSASPRARPLARPRLPSAATASRALGLALAALLGALSGTVRGAPEPLPLDLPIRLHGTVGEVTPDEGFVLLDPTIIPLAPPVPVFLPVRLPAMLLAVPWPAVLPRVSERALARPIHVSARPFDPPTPGASIEVEATLHLPRVPRNPTTVPDSRPMPYALALSDPLPSIRPASWSARATLDLRARLTFASPTATALYRALLLGDRSELEPHTRFAYQDTGTAHLLAISGMNLAVLGLGLHLLLMRLFIVFPPTRRYAQGRRISALAAALALGAVSLYGLVIAPSDATDRALIALALGLSGLVLLRRHTPMRTLALALLAATLADPEAPLRAGFQLSFAATAAIILVMPQLTSWRAFVTGPALACSRPLRWLLLAVGALVITDLATFLATLPLSLAWFGQLPVHGLWVNLLAIPFMTLLVFPLGVFWLVLASLWPAAGDLTGPALAALGDWFNQFIDATGAAVGTSTTDAWPLVLGVLATLAMLSLLRPAARARAALVLLATTGAYALTATPAAGLHLLTFDVGHGDALALRLPEGARVLVDAGGHLRPEQNRRLGERVVVPALLAAGFSRLDLMVLTHADLDHAGAASIVASRIPVAELWIPPCSRGAPAIEAVITAVSASGGRVRTVARSPPMSWSGAELELLGPPADLERGSIDPFPSCAVRENDASIVLRVSYAGRRLLLTGDIEHPAEGELLARLRGPDLRADLLKVPHHGSKTSSTEAFLDAVRPGVAIVSGLPGRAPMPPHDAVLERYAGRRIPTFITGRDGAIAAHVSPAGDLRVNPLRPP